MTGDQSRLLSNWWGKRQRGSWREGGGQFCLTLTHHCCQPKVSLCWPAQDESHADLFTSTCSKLNFQEPLSLSLPLLQVKLSRPPLSISRSPPEERMQEDKATKQGGGKFHKPQYQALRLKGSFEFLSPLFTSQPWLFSKALRFTKIGQEPTRPAPNICKCGGG